MTAMDDQVNQAIAKCMWDYAVDPSRAHNLNGVFGPPRSPATEGKVRARFGDKAAEAWATARQARIDFFAAVKDSP